MLHHFGGRTIVILQSVPSQVVSIAVSYDAEIELVLQTQ